MLIYRGPELTESLFNECSANEWGKKIFEVKILSKIYE